MSEEHGKQSSAPVTLEALKTLIPNRQFGGGDSIKTTVLQPPLVANPNPAADPEVQTMVERIMGMPVRHVSMRSALREYVSSDAALKEIATKHGYTAPALVYWVRKLGLPQRPRGRPVLLEPTDDHQRIIAEVRVHGAVETARREGVSRQRVSQIVQRWAPDLKRKRVRKNIARLRAKRGPARAIVVSFRLSPDEWRLLETAPVASDKLHISGSKKARAIVLEHIFTGGHGGSPATASMAEPQMAEGCRVENVYNLKAA